MANTLAASAQWGLKSTGLAGKNRLDAAGRRLEFGSCLGGLQNNLQTVPDVDHTDCRRGPLESLIAEAGRLDNLGWQVCFHLWTEPAFPETLARLGEYPFLDGLGHRLCEAHIRGPCD